MGNYAFRLPPKNREMSKIKRINSRKVILALADIFLICVGTLVTSYVMRFIPIKAPSIYRIVVITFFNVVYCITVMALIGIYSKLWRYFKKSDYVLCAAGMAIGFVLSYVSLILVERRPHLLYMGIDYLVSTGGVLVFRMVFRNTFLSITVASEDANKQRVMIVGAGHAASMLIGEIANHKQDGAPNGMKVVCVVDDDKAKLNCSIGGVLVKGNTNDIKMLCERERTDLIIFAIPSCDEHNRKRILALCSETKLPIKIMPYISDVMFDEKMSNVLNYIQDIKIEDLLCREPVKLDDSGVKSAIVGKVCMITGGGGSIGSEIIRQIANYSPKTIIIVDICENGAYDIQQELLMNYGSSLDVVTLIASVRDYDRMETVFRKYRPQIVFHAAAHKHVPLMEYSPSEAVKNNIVGTQNVTELADIYGTETFVLISTDKAVHPTNVMGATKRCCEMIVQNISQSGTKTKFITTRFGNVLGSNGSVIPLFKRQIESGKPVTITHPEITRYFMTIPEAVSLVLQASVYANGGGIFVLDMGEPVKIVTLAENLIKMYGKEPYTDVKIEFIGLRPGEKLYEELLLGEEGLRSTENKKIYIGNQIEINSAEFALALDELKKRAAENDEPATISALKRIVPTFTHEQTEKSAENADKA